jgi:hypothetical protein
MEHALRCIGNKLTEGMRADLAAPISMHELDEALKGMTAGKALGPDGVMTEFSKIYWDLISEDFLAMVCGAVESRRLPLGVTKGLVPLLYKGERKKHLTNWRPITLLNVGYKLFAKVLQLWLQPILMEIVSFDWLVFLPMRFILDNILLTHETLEWANHMNQKHMTWWSYLFSLRP